MQRDGTIAGGRRTAGGELAARKSSVPVQCRAITIHWGRRIVRMPLRLLLLLLLGVLSSIQTIQTRADTGVATGPDAPSLARKLRGKRQSAETLARVLF